MNSGRLLRALTTRRLLAIILFLGILVRAVQEASDSDMWWHLATGQLILTDLRIPKADPFSYTVAGTRWYTHEWLSEVGMYATYLLGGKPALIAASALIITLAFVLVYVQCSARPHAAVFLVLAGAFASAVTWGVRPQILTMAGLALISLLLTLYRRGSRWPLIAFPLLIALWVNLHAGYLLGLAYLGLNLAGDGLALILGRTGRLALPWRRWGSLALSALFTLPAVMLNPNGWYMLRYPFETLTSSAMSAYIQEWASPNFHNPAFWPFAVLLVGGTVLLVLGDRRSFDLSDLLTYTCFAVAGLYSSRHVALFAVVAPPIISRTIPWDSQRLKSATTRVALTVNWVLLFAGLAVVGLRFQYVVTHDHEVEAGFYPEAALAYVRSHGLADQRIFNSYNWGGYLIWHDMPVFIDGRADVYGDAFIREYLSTYRPTPHWRQLLEDRGVDYVLTEADGSLSTVLLEAPEWDRAYHDDVADVFVLGERPQ